MRFQQILLETMNGVSLHGNTEDLVIFGLAGSFNAKTDTVRPSVTIEKNSMRCIDFEKGNGPELSNRELTSQSAGGELQGVESLTNQTKKLAQFRC